jgi:hypothetical protein
MVRKAIDVYLRHAYDEGRLPAAVQQRLAQLVGDDAEAYFQSKAWERDAGQNPPRYKLRLGNRHYPHMKLAIDPRPDAHGFLFRADTHDRHVCPPPASKEYPLFCDLMEKNQKLSQEIETAWAEAGLTTFKTYLKDDLARRQAAVGTRPGSSQSP